MTDSTTTLTEMEDLILFLQERAQEYDSDIDTGTGSAFYNAVIQPLIDRLGPDPYVTPIREFILSRLSTEFPDLVLQDGEPMDDYLVKPMQVLLEAFRRQIQQVSTNQSVIDPDVLNEREADSLGANFFVRRRLGSYAVGVARLYFSAPQGVVVDPTNAVYDAGGQRFFPVENQAISVNTMLFNTENNLYYFDIVVRAEAEGTSYNIERNTLIGIEGLPSAVKVTNKAEFEEGGDKETTTEYLERVENSLSERSLITVRGIQARLLDVFETVRLIQVIGKGDIEMARDVLRGTTVTSPYLFFEAELTNGSTLVTLGANGAIDTGGTTYTSFLPAGLLVGDVIEGVNFTTGDYLSLEVTEVVDATSLRVDSAATADATLTLAVRRATGEITISDIPGGILIPETPQGEITIDDNAVHIGGMVDVFVRAGDPIEREMVLEGVLDDQPLHFGVDLESFGERDEYFAQITQPMARVALRPGADRFGTAVTNHLLVKQYDGASGLVPWKFTQDDIGRYIQIFDSSVGDRAILEIEDILSEEYYSNGGGFFPPQRVVRVQVSLTNEEDPGTPFTLGSDATTFDTDIAILEKIPLANKVRDRDGSRLLQASPPVYSGTDLDAIVGADVGDSVVIESGDDAGIYSVRRILDWLNTGDTLLLDRDLSKTVVPGGTGNRTGLRYRIADELDVDLVAPKVTKIPLGNIFTGADLFTLAGSNEVTVSGGTTNFLLAGVEAGDTLEIFEGDDKGEHLVTGVQGTSLTLASSLQATAFSITFSVYRAYDGIERPMVRVAQVELLDSNSQPTGITIPYGKQVDTRAVGLFANRAEGETFESFTGETQTGTGAEDIRLYDAEFDFVAEGVNPGHRLNVKNTAAVGSYTIAKVGSGDGLPSDNYIEVVATADGGTVFQETVSGVHYTVGLPSSGVARLYFQDPTSVEVTTGLAGGRLQYEESGTPLEFHFSEVDGYVMAPEGGSGDEYLQDMRAARVKGTARAITGDGSCTLLNGTSQLRDTAANFTSDIIVGDVFVVTSGEGAGSYRVVSVDSATYATVTPTPPSATGDYYVIDKYESILELTDTSRPGVYEQEIVEGDLVEVNEALPFRTQRETDASFTWPSGTDLLFRATAGDTTEISAGMWARPKNQTTYYKVVDVDSSGIWLHNPDGDTLTGVSEELSIIATFEQLGIFGSPAGLRTLTGQNRVEVPSNSLIDFEAMNQIYPIEGQKLIIDSGPDEGEYIVEEIIDSKTLRLDSVMTSTTETVAKRELSGLRDATLVPGSSSVNIVDTTDDLGSQFDHFITIFESTRGDIDGTYRIQSVVTVGDELELEMSPTEYENVDYVGGDIIPIAHGATPGLFTWVKTISDSNVSQSFRLYRTSRTQAEVTAVATKRETPDLKGIGAVLSTTLFRNDGAVNFVTEGVVPGDFLEILAGDNVGFYPIASVIDADDLQIVDNAANRFSVTVSNVPYRVWGGIHGSTRMLTVGAYESDDGYIPSEAQQPYRLVRPGVYRLSSTEMEENYDGSLYYADVQVESLGSGDAYNLARNTRMVVASGIEADGYTHQVANNIFTFSTLEEVSLKFNRRFLPVGNSDAPENMTEVSGRNLKVVYESSTTVRLVNDLLTSTADRPVCASPLARHFLPSYVYVALYYRGGVEASIVGPEIEDYINTLGATDEIEVSDLEAFISRRGADSIEHPITLVVLTHDIDRELVVNRSENRLGGELTVPYNGTGRISAFFTTLGQTLIVEKQS